jgi:pilus assembly protein CpaE
MARLSGSILTEDHEFKSQLTAMLRGGAVPVTVVDERPSRGSVQDVVVVDGRHAMDRAIAQVENVRSMDATAGIFFVATDSSPDAILTSMRAGANEFLPWPPSRELLDEGLKRTAARRASSGAAPLPAATVAFFGAKGGAGTTTVAVNFAVDVVRVTKKRTIIVDVKPGLGEVGLFLGVRSRYTLLDALDNLHRLDGEFLRELVVKHKSGLDILAGSDSFDRPGPGDTAGLEEIFRLLSKTYDYIVIDGGSQLSSCAVTALYTSDTICLVANPDVPCVRNAQRLLERIRQLGPTEERVRVLLNRAAEPFPIPPAQIQSALGHPIYHMFPSDYKTVSGALNSGVPLAMSDNSEMASQFDHFTRRLLDPGAELEPATTGNRVRSTLGLQQKLASIW